MKHPQRPYPQYQGSILLMALMITALVSMLAIWIIRQNQHQTTVSQWHTTNTRMRFAMAYAMPWAIEGYAKQWQHPRGSVLRTHPATMPPISMNQMTVDAQLSTPTQSPSMANWCCGVAPQATTKLPSPITTLLLRIHVHSHQQDLTVWRCLGHNTRGVVVTHQCDDLPTVPSSHNTLTR